MYVEKYTNKWGKKETSAGAGSFALSGDPRLPKEGRHVMY